MQVDVFGMHARISGKARVSGKARIEGDENIESNKSSGGTPAPL
jgi:hypothetical protein